MLSYQIRRRLINIHFRICMCYWLIYCLAYAEQKVAIDDPADALDGRKLMVDQTELLEYNLESNFSHLSFLFHRSFFTCNRCNPFNSQKCCQRHNVCCHIVHQCPTPDSIQCTQQCPGGCPHGQICCPQRRKLPCCTVPAHNYFLPPSSQFRVNNVHQLINSENVSANGSWNSQEKQMFRNLQLELHKSNISETSLTIDVTPTATQIQMKVGETASPPPISLSNSTQMYNDTLEFDYDDANYETTPTDFDSLATTTIETATKSSHVNEATTISFRTTLTEPQPETATTPQQPSTIGLNFSNNNSQDVTFSEQQQLILEEGSYGESSEESAIHPQTADEDFSVQAAADTPRTAPPPNWWNSEELTFEKKNDDEFNKTSSSQSAEESYVVSYFPSDDDSALADLSKYDVPINSTTIDHDGLSNSSDARRSIDGT